MLKRIKERFSQDTNNIEKLNKYGYVPSTEEVESSLGFKGLESIKRKYDF
jgi:hypothetical protein